MTDENRETFGHPIEVDLTDEEKEAKLNRNADIDRKMIEIKAEKAEANQGFNNDLKLLRKEQATLLEAITVGKAKVEVQCYQERDERRGMMLTMRCDNGHIVDERALTAEERGIAADERQGNLFDNDSDTDAGASQPDQEEEEGGDADADAKLAKYLATGGGSDEADDPDHDDDDDAEQPAVN